MLHFKKALLCSPTYSKRNGGSGFTLVEMLVAVAILLIAVVGPMSLIGNSLSQTYIARDQIVAVNLAQEGIEGVRQIRDSNLLARWGSGSAGYTVAYNKALASPVWTSGINPIPNCTVGCTLEVNPPTLTLCTGGPCTTQQILYRTPSGAFTHNSGGNIQTQFSRLITVTVINPNEITVNSTVTWMTSGGMVKTVTIQENLFGINN